jgi:pyruvate/2-oxoglutarate dehydrogenase complex dihydrolipoamide acyltransferase (E2) component
MSIRLDPRRLGALKRLAGEAGVRPGDLVRQWVEERIDAARVGPDGLTLEQRLEALAARVAALEGSAPTAAGSADEQATAEAAEPVAAEATEAAEPNAGDERPAPAEDEAPPRRRGRVSAAPAGRVALHDEMIAVLAERGPLPAGELAAAIAERGRYAPPRSGKPLDAAMVSQRASNPTYRARFRRRDGRIGLAEAESAE